MGMKSEYFISFAGVRQGVNLLYFFSYMSMTSRLTYYETIVLLFFSFSDDVLDTMLRILVLMYADDTIIMADSSEITVTIRSECHGKIL